MVLFGLLWLIAGIMWSRRMGITAREWVGAAAVGALIALAWWLTYQISAHSFDVVPVKSLSFSGPSAETLMWLLTPGRTLDFDIGLIPGVLIGSLIAALVAGEFKIVGFTDGLSMRRYLLGAVCMGFGAMLASGCAVGAGIAGSAVFSLTGWITLVCIWCAALLTDALVDRHRKIPWLLP
jgi:hypothetical protein